MSAARLVLLTAAVAGAASGCAADPPAAVVQVVVDTHCDVGDDRGMGFVLDSGLILTAAHVVAGADEISGRAAGWDGSATVVGFDPDNDIAYLQPDTKLGGGWPLADEELLSSIARGSKGFVYVERDDTFTRLPVTIVRPINLYIEDIYVDAEVERPGWELLFPVELGDSGAPVVYEGHVIGVVSVRSRDAEGRAYAIDPVRGGERLEHQLELESLSHDPTIDVARC